MPSVIKSSIDSEYDCKVLIIGDPGAGKTSLLLRIADGTYSGKFISTIGVDFKRVGINLDDGNKINLKIWDTAGQERFRTVTSPYYKDTRGIIIAYDVTDPESFNNATQWFGEICRYATDKKVKVLLVGNKSDRPKGVDFATAAEYARKLDIPFLETSAKTGENVEEAFKTMAHHILNTPNTKTNQAKLDAFIEGPKQ